MWPGWANLPVVKRLFFYLSALSIGWLGAYEVPKGVLNISELETVQQKPRRPKSQW